MNDLSNLDKALAAWGDTLPDWVRILAEECDRTSQKKTADLVEYSTAAISQVIGNKYSGDVTSIEQAVKGALLHVTVDCPVIGEMSAHVCLAHQRTRFRPTNYTRVQLYKACRNGCPHSRLKGGTS